MSLLELTFWTLCESLTFAFDGGGPESPCSTLSLRRLRASWYEVKAAANSSSVCKTSVAKSAARDAFLSPSCTNASTAVLHLLSLPWPWRAGRIQPHPRLRLREQTDRTFSAWNFYDMLSSPERNLRPACGLRR